jgi:hypothetical protein
MCVGGSWTECGGESISKSTATAELSLLEVSRLKQFL